MTTLPAAGYVSTSTRTEGDMKSALEAMVQAAKETPGGGSPTVLNVSVGAITPTAAHHFVDTGGPANANLQNAFTTNMPNGRILTLQTVTGARDVTILSGAGGDGQFTLARGATFVLADPTMSITFVLNSAHWIEINRNYGAQIAAERTALGVDQASLRMTASYNIVAADWNRQIIAAGAGPYNLNISGAFSDGFKCYFANEATGNVSFIPKSVVFKTGEGAVIMYNQGTWSVLRTIGAAAQAVPGAASLTQVSYESAGDSIYITPDKLKGSRGVSYGWVAVETGQVPPIIRASWNTSSVTREGVGIWTWNLIPSKAVPNEYWAATPEVWAGAANLALVARAQTPTSVQFHTIDFGSLAHGDAGIMRVVAHGQLVS